MRRTQHSDTARRAAAAALLCAGEHLPASAWDGLAAHPLPAVRDLTARSPWCPPATRRRLADDADTRVAAAALATLDDPDRLAAAADSASVRHRRGAARNPHTPADALAALADDVPADRRSLVGSVASGLLFNPAAPLPHGLTSARLRDWAGAPGSTQERRTDAALVAAAHPTLRSWLAGDDDAAVRSAAVSHPHPPDDAIRAAVATGGAAAQLAANPTVDASWLTRASRVRARIHHACGPDPVAAATSRDPDAIFAAIFAASPTLDLLVAANPHTRIDHAHALASRPQQSRLPAAVVAAKLLDRFGAALLPSLHTSGTYLDAAARASGAAAAWAATEPTVLADDTRLGQRLAAVDAAASAAAHLTADTVADLDAAAATWHGDLADLLATVAAYHD